jgi:hypothetical protein
MQKEEPTMFVRRVSLSIVVGILLVIGSAASAFAQSSGEEPQTYASWFDALKSFSGRATIAAQSSNQSGIDAKLTFAMVNKGDLESSDYFVEMDYAEESSPSTHNAILIKDNIVANWERYTGEWSVEDRAENASVRSLTDGLAQADAVLTSLFQQKVLLSMASQAGVETVGAREAMHYTIDLPDALVQMLIKQLGGEETLSGVAFDKAQLEFWLDQEAHILLKLHAEASMRDPERQESASIDLDLEFQNIDNVSLALPAEVRKQAMIKGLLTPDFASEVIVVDGGTAAGQ